MSALVLLHRGDYFNSHKETERIQLSEDKTQNVTRVEQ